MRILIRKIFANAAFYSSGQLQTHVPHLFGLAPGHEHWFQELTHLEGWRP